MTYKLTGRWGTTVSTSTGSLEDMRTLARNWSTAGASCTISSGHDVVEHWEEGERR